MKTKFFSKMETIQVKTNINCGNCVAKVTPFFSENPSIEFWAVDTNSPEKTLTVKGQVTENQIVELVKKAGFKVLQETQETEIAACHLPDNGTVKRKKIATDLEPTESQFWEDNKVWGRAAKNTLNCLIGCSIGDFGMILYLQAFYPETSMMTTMILAIVAGLTTSIILETILLKINEKLSWQQSLQMALGMSLISMIAMEIAMNITDFMITGGKPDFHSHVYWLAFGVAAVAGFLAPLPYNYFKLKKYNKACH